ncbi:MAG: hypothetical protein MUC29_02905 [Pyrinomonadaceae bacterium]|nr:hypothetical protein [Pyrinomonadaceae bacterium]
MKPYTIFMLVKTTTEWLKLKPKERFEFLGKDIQPILVKHPTVKMRFFDAEAYDADITDVIVWETENLKEYEYLVEELRESLFWETYFTVEKILLTVEEAYADFYKVEPIST